MKIKAILFDIDGTLVDSNDMHVLAWEEAFARMGEVFDRAAIHGQIGKGADMLIPTLLPDLDEESAKQLADSQGEIFKSKFLQEAKPFPQAHQLLAHVRAKGQDVVLATSSSQEQLEHYLGLLDAHDLVTATTSSGDVENTKPAPDIFSTALGKLPDLQPQHVLVIGDTPYDIQAASKCGIATVAVRSGGFADDVLREAGAIAIYDDVTAILADYDASPLGAADELTQLESDKIVAAASLPA
jgi:membrane protein